MEKKIKVTIEATKEELAQLFNNTTNDIIRDPLLSAISSGFLNYLTTASEICIFLFLYSNKDANGVVSVSQGDIMKNLPVADNPMTIRRTMKSLQDMQIITKIADASSGSSARYKININTIKNGSAGEANKKIFKRTIRERVNDYIKRAGYGKSSKKPEDILGISYDAFVDHIESSFLQGMSWNNKKSWSIDHVIPISNAKTLEEAEKLNHYTNLKPLWNIENSKKGKK